MLMFINFFLGSVYVEVQGSYVERFLNLCSKNGVGFWDMSRPAPDIIRIRVTVPNYRKLRAYAKKAMCHMHILSKSGLPFFTVKFKKRIALIVGLTVFLTIAWVLTSFIWVIDIRGYDQVDVSKLQELLRANGVYIGAYGPSVHIDELKNDILLNMPELSYVGVNLSGSHAEVQVRERALPPEMEASDEPVNIVAKRGGIITSVVVQSGTPEVQKGDTVTEGQLLASPYMTGRSGTTVVTRAKADIRARTWQTMTCKMPLETRLKTQTGRITQRKTLVLGGRRVKLFLKSGIPYAECDKIVQTSYLTLPGNLRLPIALETEEFREYESSDYLIPLETALEYMSERMESYLKLDEETQLLNKNFAAGLDGTVARVTMTAECEEAIGVEQMIPKGE